MSTAQQSNNRGIVAVTKSSDLKTITNPGDAVQIFSLEAGTVDNTVAFVCDNGSEAGKYIGSASSTANYLRSFATPGANTSFTVTIEDGYTVLVANGSNTHNVMRYNSGSSCISCYAPTSSQTEVALYVLEGSGEGSSLIDDPKCPAPVISFDPSTNKVTITCSAANATVGYTTDGTDPAEGSSSTTITDELPIEFTITATTTVKAIAGAPGYRMSDIAEEECVPGGSETTEELSGTFTLTNGELRLTTASGITVVQSKVSGNTSVNGSYNTPSTLRVYKGHALTFSGKTIKKIEITVDGNYYGNTLTANTGTLTPTSTSGGTIVWTGSSTSVTITNNATGANVQLRPSKIVVTY